MHKSSKPEMSDIITSHSELNLSNTSVTSNSLSSTLYTLFNTIPDTKLKTSISSTKVERLDIPDTLASSIPAIQRILLLKIYFPVLHLSCKNLVLLQPSLHKNVWTLNPFLMKIFMMLLFTAKKLKG